MPKLDRTTVVREAKDYLRKHPEEIVRTLRGALGLRFGVPMDAVRYLVRELVVGKKAPTDIVVEAAPPGARISLTVRVMGASMRPTLTVFIEELHVDAEQIRLGLRVEGLSIEVLGDKTSPLATFLASGTLDLSKAGNLVTILPNRPPAIVDAKDDRIVLDLMKVPSIAGNAKLRRALTVLAPVLGVRALRTRDDHLDMHLQANLSGLGEAIALARAPRT